MMNQNGRCQTNQYRIPNHQYNHQAEQYYSNDGHRTCFLPPGNLYQTNAVYHLKNPQQHRLYLPMKLAEYLLNKTPSGVDTHIP